MNKKSASIDLFKLGMYILKRGWLLVICAAIGFGVMYWRASKSPDTYTASGTMFVTNNNPNLVNYGSISTTDISGAVQLVNIYSEVVKSEKVMQRVLEYPTKVTMSDGTEAEVLLGQKYPMLTTAYLRNSFSMTSVNETPMVYVYCTTTNPELSYDICTALLNVAPTEITNVVGAGDAKPQDYPVMPEFANGRADRRQGLKGALLGIAGAAALLGLLFLFNQRVEDPKELTDNYTLPVLSTVRRRRGDSEDPASFLLSDKSDMDLVESYAKLRMNLMYTLVKKERRAVMLTSAVSGEGKSTVAANLAVSLAMGGKRVLLVDADMRRACQHNVFRYSEKAVGLSDILIGNVEASEAVLASGRTNLDILPAGSLPPNPSELLDSPAMCELIKAFEAEYDLILLDAPPINIVSDPLALSSEVAGALFVVRQHFSDHREIRKALISAEMTGLDLLGFVFYGERIDQGNYYSRKYYRGYMYYNNYDTRAQAAANSKTVSPAREDPKDPVKAEIAPKDTRVGSPAGTEKTEPEMNDTQAKPAAGPDQSGPETIDTERSTVAVRRGKHHAEIQDVIAGTDPAADDDGKHHGGRGDK